MLNAVLCERPLSGDVAKFVPVMYANLTCKFVQRVTTSTQYQTKLSDS